MVGMMKNCMMRLRALIHKVSLFAVFTVIVQRGGALQDVLHASVRQRHPGL